MTTPRLRYVESGAADGFTNMAVDEVLLGECEAGVIDGALRVYEWAPPAVSLGHAQPLDLIDPAKCRQLGVDLVRRVTGGGAVLHWEEVTYCLVLRRERLPALRWPREFARIISTALCGCLRSLGLEASLSQGAESGGERSPLCFSSGNENEIVVGGRKLVGCAHKFTKRAFFSHGSIMTGLSHVRIVELVSTGAKTLSSSEMRERSVPMSEFLGRVPRLEAVGRELKKGVEAGFGLSFVDGRLSGREEEEASEGALAKKVETGSLVDAIAEARVPK